jgi:hypothetical protein
MVTLNAVIWWCSGCCSKLPGMGRLPSSTPPHLNTARELLEAVRARGLFAALTGTTLAFQALDQAPALLEPPMEPDGRWTLKVYFLLDEQDRPREAAQTFLAGGGGKVLLQGNRLTVTSGLTGPGPDLLLALYGTACRMSDCLRQVRVRS